MPLQIFLFIIGLLMLIKGGDWFVDSATGIARRFHLPELLIGATVVSIGTTLPEVMVSAQGAAAGSGAMAYGNAIGSIICNTSLIAALTIAIKPSKVDRKPMILPVCFFFGAAVFYSVIAYATGKFSRWVGIVLLVGFVVYMVITVLSMKKKDNDASVEVEASKVTSPENTEAEDEKKGFSAVGFIIELAVSVMGGGFMIYKGGVIGYFGIALIAIFVVYALLVIVMKLAKKELTSIVKDIMFILIGAAIIAGGANLLVDSGTFIAKELGVPETVISLTFVALGTSLPELVTAITSLVKGHGSLSLGNIIGANLFNLVLVSGVSTVIAPFDVPSVSKLFGINSSFIVDIPLMFAVMALMTIPAIIRGKLSRLQGIILLCLYAGFCALQFTVFAN